LYKRQRGVPYGLRYKRFVFVRLIT
jgi:hypothetical protein